MSSAIAVARPGRRVGMRSSTEAHERWIRRRVGLAWGLMVFDVLTFYPGISVLHIPSIVGKALTQGALPVALLVALSVNRKVIVRPSIFLCLATLVVFGALLTCTQAARLGAFYRVFRLGEFVAGLWLLSAWWGRRDLLLVRCHLAAMAAVLGSVVVGLLIAPGHALVNGRLTGALWPIPPTQVGHYCAVTTGLVVVLWLAGCLPGRVTLPIVAVTATLLLQTHTRTALLATVAGILIAGLSLFTAKARVRKFFAVAGAVVSIGVLTLAGVLATWLERGQNSQELTNLTGRTLVWSLVLNYPRDKFQEFFGFGLSYTSFNGLPIDSNWLAAYMAQGLFGVAMCVAMLLFLLVTAYFQPRGVRRALALFLVTYCLVASFTETGFTDASTYLLEMSLAASLLVPSRLGSGPG